MSAPSIATSSVGMTERERVIRPQDNWDRVIGYRDVLLEILECISRVGGSSKRTLINLALAGNKTVVLSPVLDLVWKEMHSLVPFFAVLDTETAILGDDSEIQILTGQTSPLANPNFVKYAVRLRSVVFDHAPRDTNFDILSLMRTAKFLGANHCLFPRLESVAFDNFEITHVMVAHTIHFSFCPNITKLAFTKLYKEDIELAHVLSLASNNFLGTIKDLTVIMPDPDRQFRMGHALTEYLPKFTELTHLHLRSLNPDFPIFQLLPWIATLHTLKVLRIEVRVRRVEAIVRTIQVPRSRAESLASLRIEGSVPFIQAILPMFYDNGEGCNIVLAPMPAVTPDVHQQIAASVSARIYRPNIRFEAPVIGKEEEDDMFVDD